MKTSMNLRAACRASSCAVALLVGGAVLTPAVAQQVIERITVTAQRREEALKDVPLSVAAMNPETLQALTASAPDVRFLSNRIPSVTAESSFGRTFPRFYIRGLGNTDFDLNASQPVSMLYDGVVLENPIVKGFPVFDLARIEVARGPQGTLYGRNTPAGIISFISKKPTDEFEAYAHGNYGRFNAVNLEGAVSGPIADGFSMRASGVFQRRDDWVDNLNTATTGTREFEGFEEMAGRLQFMFEPTEQTSILFNIHARHLDGTARLFRANILGPGSSSLNQNFDRDSVFVDGINFQEVDEIGGVLTIDHDFGEVTLTAITGYESVETLSRGDIDGGVAGVGPGFIPFSAETADGIPSLDQWSQEVRVASNDWERFNFQAGVYYFFEDVDIDSFNYLAPASPVVSIYATQTQETTSWSLFAHGTYAVTDQLTLAAGARYSDDEKEFSATRVLDPIFPALPLGTTTRNPSDENVAWDVSATYAISDETNIYARIASSFRPPSIQGRLLFASLIDGVTVADSETNVSYEAGVKSDIADGRGFVSLAGFYYELEDQQLTAVGGAVNANRLINADQTIGYGFEAEAEYAPIEQLMFTAGMSYNHTEIDDADLTVAPCGFPFPNCTILDPTTPGGLALIDGNPLPQAPEIIANFTIRVSENIGQGEIYLFTDWAYRSEINFFLYESAEFRDERLFEGGIRIGYIHNDGQWEVSLFGRNILDDESAESGIDFNNLTGMVNEPATWGIEIGARW
jgi:iron complex outermembrane recepter protein